jgi:UDP-N-acetyl-D-galactosamine dehydrogenase
MLGITFKENCPDVRNTKIVDVISSLADYGIKVSVYDPWANPEEVKHEYGLTTSNECPKDQFDAVVLGVAHDLFADIDYSKIKKDNAVLYDVKGILGHIADGKL